jgi:hypothetical protein
VPEQEIAEHDHTYRLTYRAPLPVDGWNAQISLLTGMAAADLMLAPHPPRGPRRRRRPAAPYRARPAHRLAAPRLVRTARPLPRPAPPAPRGLPPGVHDPAARRPLRRLPRRRAPRHHHPRRRRRPLHPLHGPPPPSRRPLRHRALPGRHGG